MRSASMWCAAVLALAISGCLDIEREVFILVVSPDGKRAELLHVAEGLFVEGETKEDRESAERELRAAVTTNTRLAVGMSSATWLLPAPDFSQPTESSLLAAVLRRHVRLSRGTPYLNEHDELCLYRRAAIGDLPVFIAGLNACTSSGFADWTAWLETDPGPSRVKPDPERSTDRRARDAAWSLWDVESIALLAEAARRQSEWIRTEPGRLHFTLPLTPATFYRLKNRFLTVSLDDLAEPERDTKTAGNGPPAIPADQLLEKLQANVKRVRRELTVAHALLSDNDWSVTQQPTAATFTLGLGGERPIQLRFRLGKTGNPAHDAALKAAAAEAAVAQLDVRFTDTLIEDFLAGRLAGPEPEALPMP